MSTAYKATYNLKCRNQTYKVGKTYESDKLKICKHGFHYCSKMGDVLFHYNPTKDFVLLEVEILGNVIDDEEYDHKSVTDKMKVIRIIPLDEYSEEMKLQFPKFEYDDLGKVIRETRVDGEVISYEYDDRNNTVSKTYLDGYKISYEYDALNNLTTEIYPNGRAIMFFYDDSNNRIAFTYPGCDKYCVDQDNLTVVTEY